MQYLYNEKSGDLHLILSGEDHRYIFKVRRLKKGETIRLRNLRDQMLYSYEIEGIDKKEALLRLTSSTEFVVEAKRKLHIGWCLIDPKSIEKVLPSLNEIGVEKITFIYCDRSQKNFRLDFRRLEKILLNSSQQCGRSVMMELDTAERLEVFLDSNPESWMLNFSDNSIEAFAEKIDTVVIGAEGGFSNEESQLFDPERIVGLDTGLILRSESAVCAAASKLLL